MNLDLDMLGAIICGATAVTLFLIHAITSRRYQHWVTLPEHLRCGVFCAGGVFMLRSVNFLTLPSLEAGHANALSVLTGAILLYVLISAAVWIHQTLRAHHVVEPDAPPIRITSRRPS